ncbi:unnamed protein product [Rotaria sp. Silwood2]|nr:unnamed protein product [Rotaria sp. Silwood2]CAF2553978.1 unnamed protein product [Rotaria sp. Silwood2]CAF2774639.1 unnamed protein product [Rotaria sp. Silwood2]CAF2961517.1 unnamed protein product [Rotaria sp. Silwood2]CAF3931437.1 unnamed protein product [Rotaria sp. Silwood2]
MYYAFVIVGFLFTAYGYAHSNEDRYYFESILQALWRYPIVKQILIRLCSKELDKCKHDQMLRAYTNMINDHNLQQILDSLIECFINSETCIQNDDWQQWSEWSSCSVSCGIGRIVRTRSCKSDRQCLIGSYSTQTDYCFIKSCTTNNDRKHLNILEDNIISHTIDHKLIRNNLNIIFIFIFPFFFTLLCIPLCVYYYIYECDFKIHALTIYILSLCNRHCEAKKRRINTSL